MVTCIHPQCAPSRSCGFQAHLVFETRPPSGSSCVGQFSPVTGFQIDPRRLLTGYVLNYPCGKAPRGGYLESKPTRKGR